MCQAKVRGYTKDRFPKEDEFEPNWSKYKQSFSSFFTKFKIQCASWIRANGGRRPQEEEEGGPPEDREEERQEGVREERQTAETDGQGALPATATAIVAGRSRPFTRSAAAAQCTAAAGPVTMHNEGEEEEEDEWFTTSHLAAVEGRLAETHVKAALPPATAAAGLSSRYPGRPSGVSATSTPPTSRPAISSRELLQPELAGPLDQREVEEVTVGLDEMQLKSPREQCPPPSEESAGVEGEQESEDGKEDATPDERGANFPPRVRRWWNWYRNNNGRANGWKVKRLPPDADPWSLPKPGSGTWSEGRDSEGGGGGTAQ